MPSFVEAIYTQHILDALEPGMVFFFADMPEQRWTDMIENTMGSPRYLKRYSTIYYAMLSLWEIDEIACASLHMILESNSPLVFRYSLYKMKNSITRNKDRQENNLVTDQIRKLF